MDYHRSIHGTAKKKTWAGSLDELDKLGLTENTMVIFTSDNGYYWGEHRLGEQAIGLRREHARADAYLCAIRNWPKKASAWIRP